MIEKHLVTRINNEEVLVIYLNYNYEISKLGVKGKSFLDSVRNYCIDKKIIFNGSKILLVVFGVMIGSIVVNKDFFVDNKVNSAYVETVDLVSSPRYITIDDVVKDAVKNTSDITDDSIKDQYIEEVVDNNIYVSVYRNNGEVLNIELEEYVISVVSAEMPASFSVEALKAQSVVTRTYTLRMLNRQKKITEDMQSFKSINELKSYWGNNFDFYYNKVRDAVNSTKGVYMMYGNEIVDAVYHSTSNGYTEDAIYVWGYDIPYLKMVDSSFDKDATSYLRDTFFSYEELSKKLGFSVDSNSNFDIISYTSSNRVNAISVLDREYNGIDFRNILGLRSSDFSFTKSDSGITFTTHGYGHGVGMSQYGASYLGNNGYSYEDILNYYYKGISFVK